MTLIRFMKNTLLAGAFAFVAIGCSDDGGGGDIDAGMEPDAGMEYMCDPVGANPDVGALLNAPVDDDVEVIVKQPQHPGEPGPDNLP